MSREGQRRQALFKASDDLIVREMTNWKQVLFHPDGVPDASGIGYILALAIKIKSLMDRGTPNRAAWIRMPARVAKKPFEGAIKKLEERFDLQVLYPVLV